MGKKSHRIKPNENQIQKEIQDNLKGRMIFMIPNKDSIEFIQPDDNGFNSRFFRNRPMMKVDAEGRMDPNGKLDYLRYFYIPKAKQQALNNLLNDFNMPESIHNDLIWVFLNMAFAASEAKYITNLYAELRNKQKELFEALDLLEGLAQGKLLLQEVTIVYSECAKESDARTGQGSRKFKGHIAVQFLEKILLNYENSEGYGVAKMIYEMYKQYGAPEMFEGNKNAEKASQSDYSLVIFGFLNNQLSNSAFDLWEDKEKYEAEMARLKGLYSRRKVYLFIGKLMLLSGLLKMKSPDIDDDIIIEIIEKKLKQKRNSLAKRYERIDELGRNQKDGAMEVIPLHKLF